MEAEHGVREHSAEGRRMRPQGHRAWNRAAKFVALLLCLGSAGCKTSGFKETFMALDSSGQRRRQHFFADTEEIHCIAKMASGVDDVTVTGVLRAQRLWDAKRAAFRDEDVLEATDEVAPGAGKDIIVDFKLKRVNEDGPYTPGDYTCELSIDGELQAVVPFDIAFPACPAAPVVQGGFCQGFVAPGSTCPSLIGAPCQCGTSGDWECQ